MAVTSGRKCAGPVFATGANAFSDNERP